MGFNTTRDAWWKNDNHEGLADIFIWWSESRGKVYYWLQSQTPLGRRMLNGYEGPKEFTGRGSVQKARKALRLVVEARESGKKRSPKKVAVAKGNKPENAVASSDDEHTASGASKVIILPDDLAERITKDAEWYGKTPNKVVEDILRRHSAMDVYGC